MGRVGSLAWVAAGAVATAALFLSGIGLLGVLPVLIAAALLARVIRDRVPERVRARVRAVMDRAFVGFFAVFVGGAVVFLLAGLAPALAHSIPSFHDALHDYAGAVERSVQVAARGNAYDLEQVTLPSGLATVTFTNLDVGVDHNVAIYSGTATERELVFRGDVIRGTSSITYRFQSPPPVIARVL